MRFGVCPVRGTMPLWVWFRGRFTPFRSDALSVNNAHHSSRSTQHTAIIAIQTLLVDSRTMASSLASSVTSLQSSLQLLDNSITTLDSGVNDFPRLCKVLQTTRV